MKALSTAFRISLFTLALTGIVYPLLVTGMAQALFHKAAMGSLVTDEKGTPVGSELIAQGFAAPGYFHPRPSAAGSGWDATASGGTNLGVTSAKLHQEMQKLAADYRAENALSDGAEVPADAVTRSGSGLDPHISPKNATLQVARVARARGISPERVQVLLQGSVEGADLGFLGEPRVNVLLLNLALDRQFGAPLR
jgi:K+-transporting ATPase ATPase C chain